MTVQIHLRRVIRRISDDALLDIKSMTEKEVNRRMENDKNNVTQVVRD